VTSPYDFWVPEVIAIAIILSLRPAWDEKTAKAELRAAAYLKHVIAPDGVRIIDFVPDPKEPQPRVKSRLMAVEGTGRNAWHFLRSDVEEAFKVSATAASPAPPAEHGGSTSSSPPEGTADVTADPMAPPRRPPDYSKAEIDLVIFMEENSKREEPYIKEVVENYAIKTLGLSASEFRRVYEEHPELHARAGKRRSKTEKKSRRKSR
jgi:hypothetical protein